MHKMIDSPDDPVDPRDLIPYTFPDIKQLAKLRYCSVALGSFIPWDYEKNTNLIKEKLGWKVDVLEGVPGELNQHGEKIECFMQASRDYIKFVKRGYSRVTQLNAFKVRKGAMSSSEALSLNDKYDGRKPHSLQIFLEYVGLTEVEFREILSTLSIPPYQHDFDQDELSDMPWDFDQWFRESSLTS